jgi:hypothetical protein
MMPQRRHTGPHQGERPPAVCRLRLPELPRPVRTPRARRSPRGRPAVEDEVAPHRAERLAVPHTRQQGPPPKGGSFRALSGGEHGRNRAGVPRRGPRVRPTGRADQFREVAAGQPPPRRLSDRSSVTAITIAGLASVTILGANGGTDGSEELSASTLLRVGAPLTGAPADDPAVTSTQPRSVLDAVGLLDHRGSILSGSKSCVAGTDIAATPTSAQRHDSKRGIPCMHDCPGAHWP